MAFDNDIRTLLLSFVEDEDAALSDGRPGLFWSSNHHRIQPRLRKAETVLTPTDLRRLYLHVLRMTGKIPPVSKASITSLIEGCIRRPWRRAARESASYLTAPERR